MREILGRFVHRTPIARVLLDWNGLGYTTASFGREAAEPGFPGWPGDRPDGEEAAVIARLLGLEPGAAALDVACGFGRHALLLAREHGLAMTGVDIVPGLIENARRRAAEAGVKIEYRVGDARSLDWDGGFAGAVIGYNTFSIFSLEDAPKVLAGVHRALDPGGRLFLDLDNRAHAVRYGGGFTDWSLTRAGFKLQEACFHRDVSVEVARDMYFDLLCGTVREFLILKRLYSFDEIERVLGESGFRVEQSYGDWELGDLAASRPKMLLVAVRA